ncbi:hypothetical protein M3Y97_00175600 [Aphelenchoides bicaudatus]|nr:hypothetical protein M3Y97_00175600 [Aphelenchoides bicaudatus]
MWWSRLQAGFLQVIMDIFYANALNTVRDCRRRFDNIQLELQAMHVILQEKRQQVMELYAVLLEQKNIDNIIQLLQDVKNLSRTIDDLMNKRNCRRALEQLKFLDALLYEPPLKSLPALDEERKRTLQRLEKCHRKVANELEREC